MELFLRTQGHAVWGVASAGDFWRQLHLSPADIVCVDIGFQGEDGFSVVDHLRQIRRHGIVVTSARGSQQERMRVLSLGADTYMVKPVNLADLHRSVTDLWCRLKQNEDQGGSTAQSESEWHLQGQMLISPEGMGLLLSPQEKMLISTLLRHRNSICSKEQLHDKLFGYNPEPDTHRIDVVMSRLRSKAREQQYSLPIRSLFGKGLTFVDEKEDF